MSDVTKMSREKRRRYVMARANGTHRRFVAVIIEFADDGELADFQCDVQWRSDGLSLRQAVEEVLHRYDLAGAVHPRLYDVMPHPYAPYTHDMTVRGLHF